MKIQEGYMPFMGHETYYRIAGECTGNRKPLLLLHGGPGSGHDYFEVLDCLAEEGRASVIYGSHVPARMQKNMKVARKLQVSGQ